MNRFDELNDRWFRVFEQPNDLDKSRKFQVIPHNVVFEDVQLLQARVKELEAEVAGLYNQNSSHYGPLVKIENGELYYRILGLFTKLSSITAALTFLNSLLDDKTSKQFAREHGADVVENIKQVFNFPK